MVIDRWKIRKHKKALSKKSLLRKALAKDKI